MPLICANKRLPIKSIRHRHVPVPDPGQPSTAQLAEVAHWPGSRDHGVNLYAHCKGGLGRAATMAVRLLVLDGDGLNDTVDQVRSARPELRLNDEQLAWLRLVEKQCADKL